MTEKSLRERRQRPRVLVIDDEPSVVATLRRILGKRFDVVGMQSGREALALLGSDDAFDLVLCDLMMPDLTGMELYDQVALSHPELLPRFVFVTGGGTTLRAREFLAHVPGPRIDKPFLPEQILGLAEQLLTTPGLLNL